MVFPFSCSCFMSNMYAEKQIYDFCQQFYNFHFEPPRTLNPSPSTSFPTFHIFSCWRLLKKLASLIQFMSSQIDHKMEIFIHEYRQELFRISLLGFQNSHSLPSSDRNFPIMKWFLIVRNNNVRSCSFRISLSINSIVNEKEINAMPFFAC